MKTLLPLMRDLLLDGAFTTMWTLGTSDGDLSVFAFNKVGVKMLQVAVNSFYLSHAVYLFTY
jgi:hypothetical protein